MKLLFLIIQSLSIISALMVILTPNPVHSVLFLIFTFLNSSLIISFLENYFMSLLFLIIYVGAIAVLFLFIIMMINIKIKTVESKNNGSFLFSVFSLGFLFIFSLLVLIDQYQTDLDSYDIALLNSIGYFVEYTDYFKLIESSPLPELLGQVLYTHYFVCFILAGMILLVAMIGAIVLTLDRSKATSLKQQAYQQISRKAENAVFTVS